MVRNSSNGISKEITLGDYIPFYFGVKMPMLYVIQNGGNFIEKTPAKEIIYLVCQLGEIVNLGNEFYFSDGHATDNLSTFYDCDVINQILSIIDWDAINQTYWGGEGNLEIKRKKQAEFLIKGDIPFKYIKKFICYNEEAKNSLLLLGVDYMMIEINDNAYY